MPSVIQKRSHVLTLPVRLFCARAFVPLPFSQAKPSPRTAAPNVQARGRFKLKRERRNILNLKNREKSKIITHTKQNRSHSHALAIPPTKFFRPALGSKIHVVDLDLSGFSRASFLCYISHLSLAELRSISPAGTRPTELPFVVHTLYKNIPIIHSTFRQGNLDISISSS